MPEARPSAHPSGQHDDGVQDKESATNAGPRASLVATVYSNSWVLLKFIIASVALYPAIRLNLDSAAGQGSTWATVAIGFVVFGAVAVQRGR